MNWLEALVILAAGAAAGTINAVVGSGTLITFPVLLAFGYPPVSANVSNTLGLVPGGISGAYGFRRELLGQRSRIVRCGIAQVLGGITGALLLLNLPAAAFKAIVPILILVALVLVVVQPRISRALAARRKQAPVHASWWSLLAIYGCGIYGGYFGAAQGVLMISVLALSFDDTLARLNGLKNVLTMFANLVAAVIFIIVTIVRPAPDRAIDWTAAILIAVGSTIGGYVGAQVGRRLPPTALRGVIVVVGLVAIWRLLFP